jgi:hypothetical protein
VIYQLMKLDRSWRAAPLLTVVSAVAAPLLLRLGVSSSTQFNGIPLILVCISVLICRVNERAALFQISLPIAGREVFAARVLSMLAVLWAPAIITSDILSHLGPEGLATARQLLGMTAVATLVIFTVQSFRVQVLEITSTITSLLPALILLPWAMWPFPVAPVLAVCLPATAILFVRIWILIPKSFQTAQPEAISESVAAADFTCRATAPMRRIHALAWMPILRSVYSWQYLVWVLFVLCSQNGGMVFSGTIFLFFFCVVTRTRIRWLSALPISRSTILPLFVTPVLLSLVAGYFVGVLDGQPGKQILMIPTQNWAPTFAEAENAKVAMLNIVPPLEFWRPVHADKAPLIQTPWGETFQPPISTVLGERIYNPYAVGGDNSQRFFDWQFARATLATNGRSIPRSEYQGPGHWNPPSATPPARIQILQIAAILSFALVLLGSVMAFDWYRFRRLTQIARGIIGLVLFSSLCTIMLQDRPPGRIFEESRLNSLLLRLSWTLPDSLFIVIAVGAATLAGIYWLVDKVLREAEFVEKPQQAAT